MTTEQLTTTELVEILEQSTAHRDLIRYVKKADERGGTPLLSSLRQSLNHVTAEKWASRGTQIEESLYREGARGALQRGNLDTTNTEICEEIIQEYHTGKA